MKKSWLLLALLLLGGALAFLTFRPGMGGNPPRRTMELVPKVHGTPGEGPPARAAAIPEAEQGLPEAGRSGLQGGRSTRMAPAPPRAAFGSLRFRIVDPEGRAAPDAWAEVQEDPAAVPGTLGFPLPDQSDQARPLREEADSDGWVFLEEVPARVRLQLSALGRFRARRRFRVAPLNPGEDRELGELVLAPGVELVGQVRDPSGRPVAAELELLEPRRDNTFLLNGAESAVASTTSSEDGQYSLPGLKPGSYVLAARAPDFSPSRLSVDLSLQPRTTRRDLHLTRGGTISGVVHGPDDLDLSTARIALVPFQSLQSFSWDRKRVLRDGRTLLPDGRFTLSGVPRDEAMEIRAAAPGQLVAHSGRVTPGLPVTLELRPALQVRGTVSGSTGTPVAEARIDLQAVGASGRVQTSPSRHQSSAADGSFLFDELQPGRYRLRARGTEGTATSAVFQLSSTTKPIALVLQGGSPVVVQARAPDGSPLPDVAILISPSRIPAAQGLDSGGSTDLPLLEGRSPRSGRTGADGTLRFLGLPPGSYRVEASAPGRATLRVALERPTESEQTLAITLPRASTLRVHVVGGGGEPVPGAALTMRPLQGPSGIPSPGAVPAPRSADDWGLAVWSDLPPGDYAISLRRNGSRVPFPNGPPGSRSRRIDSGSGPSSTPIDLQVHLPAGTVQDEQLVVASKGMLKVHVLRFGESVPGAQVELHEDGEKDYPMFFGGPTHRRATSDAKGWARLPPAAPGRYQLRARASADRPYTVKGIELVPGSQELAIDLGGGRIRGMILREDRPVVDAAIKLAPASEGGEHTTVSSISIMSASSAGEAPVVETREFIPGESSLRSRSDGSFLFQDVPAGSWRIHVESPGSPKWNSEVLTSDGVSEIDLGTILLHGAGSVQGKILGLPARKADENRFSPIMVSLLDEQGENVGFTFPSAEGLYSFEDIAPGRYHLRVGVPGREGDRLESAVFDIHAGDTTHFDFTLP